MARDNDPYCFGSAYLVETGEAKSSDVNRTPAFLNIHISRRQAPWTRTWPHQRSQQRLRENLVKSFAQPPTAYPQYTFVNLQTWLCLLRRGLRLLRLRLLYLFVCLLLLTLFLIFLAAFVAHVVVPSDRDSLLRRISISNGRHCH
jgi:hypothetical protein